MDGDGWDDDDDGWEKDNDDGYFDAIGDTQKAAGSSLRLAASSTTTKSNADGWGGDWDLDLDGSGGKSLSSSSSRLGLKTSTSSGAGDSGLMVHAKPVTHVTPLSADDLFSMLDGPKPGQGGGITVNRKSSLDTSASGGQTATINPPSKAPAQADKMEEFRKRQAERKKGRLQAKKMEIKDSGGGWDDF